MKIYSVCFFANKTKGGMDIMSDFLMKPKIDYTFKEIMMDEQFPVRRLKAQPGRYPQNRNIKYQE